MNTYKATIKVNSRLLTPLRADTIFGHIAWGIARHEGAEALEVFLDSFTPDPQLVVSSAFPAGCLPIPLLAKDSVRHKDVKSYSQAKRGKRYRYVPAAALITGKPVFRSALVDAAASLHHEEWIQQALHNTVDRFGSGTLEDTGLYQVRECWLAYRNQDDTIKSALMDIHLVSKMDNARIRTLLEWAFETGFGAKSSTGAGRIEVMGVELSNLPSSGNRAMALAPFVLTDPATLSGLRATVFVRHGKLAQEFGSVMNPFKKPILFFDEGATFEPPETSSYVGTMVKNIHADERIRQHGFAPICRFYDEGVDSMNRRIP